jgi:hypothetical protein
MDSSGNFGYDTITLGWQGSGGPTISHAVVANIADSKYWLGEFGLNPRSTNFSIYSDPQPSALDKLYQNNSIPSRSWGYTAGNQYRLNAVFGSLVLGGYDQNRFKPTNVTFPFYTDISRDLLVNLQSIKTDDGTDLLPGGTIPVFLDSTTALMWLPESACSAFEKAFNLTYDTTYNYYLLNSTQRTALQNANPNVTFTIGPSATGGETVDITFPYGAFDLTLKYPNIENPNSSYYFPLQKAANSTQYTFGRTFFQEAYVVADYERSNFTVAPCVWNDNVSTSDIKSILSPNETSIATGSSSGISGGAIAGVVVGIVAAIAILGALLWFLRRKKQVQKKRAAELEAKEAQGAAKDSADTSSEQKPFISGPIGGELGGGEIHEMNAPYKPQAQEMDSPYKMDPNKHGYSEMEGGEYFGPGKNFAHEMQGSGTEIYEMAGSDVHEMPGVPVTREEKASGAGQQQGQR